MYCLILLETTVDYFFAGTSLLPPELDFFNQAPAIANPPAAAAQAATGQRESATSDEDSGSRTPPVGGGGGPINCKAAAAAVIPAGIVRKSASNVSMKKAVKKSASNVVRPSAKSDDKMLALKKKYVEQRIARSVLESRTLTRSQTTKSPPSKGDKTKQKVSVIAGFIFGYFFGGF